MKRGCLTTTLFIMWTNRVICKKVLDLKKLLMPIAMVFVIFSFTSNAHALTIQRITDNSVADRDPSLYNGKIAWQGQDGVGGDWEIFYWDGFTVFQITNNGVHERFPSLWEDQIAWFGPDESGDDWEIWLASNLPAVPEPSTLVLLGGGLVGLSWRFKKRGRGLTHT